LESQVPSAGLTVTGRFWRPSRSFAATSSGVALGKNTPPVAEAIAAAWPVASSPSPPETTLIAITWILAAWRAAIACACVIPRAGSWPEASPNQAMMRVESLRNPTDGSVASL
jgi:hypothetical protein